MQARKPGSEMAMATALVFLSFLMRSTVDATGYMSTIATMRGHPKEVQNSFALCVLGAGTTRPSCWGTYSIGGDTSPPSNISLWSINGGAYFSCGLLSGSHFPVCWGQSPGSQIPEEFQQVSYSEINSGGWHACGVRSKTSDLPGFLDCWGSNDFGQAAQSERPSRMFSVTAGEYFTCALGAETRMPLCWGRISSRDIEVPQDLVFLKIFAGRTHVCGILQESREAVCWGDNDHGKSDAPAGISFSALSPGIAHTCGIKDDSHEVACWGDNRHGQLEAPPNVKFSAISAGDWYTCGVAFPGRKLICWGSLNYTRQLQVRSGLCEGTCGADHHELRNSDCNSADEKICLPCARCKQGSYEASPCTSSSDRICSDCSRCLSDHSCRKVCPLTGSEAPSPPPLFPSAPTPSQSSMLHSVGLVLLLSAFAGLV